MRFLQNNGIFTSRTPSTTHRAFDTGRCCISIQLNGATEVTNKHLRFLPLLLCLALFAPHDAPAKWYRQDAAIMGTAVAVQLWYDDDAKGRALTQAVIDEMRRIDKLMSTYKPGSELSRLNARAASEAVPVSTELLALIQRALEFSPITDGAFDITYASAGQYYDFRKRIHPSEAQLAQAVPAIDYHHVLVDSEHETVRFSQAGVRIDLGGIAKGYAVDRCVALLRAAGVESAMVNAGGDTRVVGKHWKQPWMVGIRDPRHKDGMVTLLPLEDAAISTSGDYERYFEQDGVRYHHILNPRTGTSSSGVRSVSIIGTDATTTDALSTGVFVMGVDAGLRLVNSLPDIEAVIIDNQGKMFYSSGLEQLPW
jgi:thiamine biosynthesis lipoprotein